MGKAVRMADIAARIGVSTVTVSKALAGKDGVSDEIREKIKALAQEMGYRSAGYGTRAVKRTGNIGILIPARFIVKGRSFYWKLYESMVRKLAESGYYGILEIVQHEEEQGLAEPHTLQDRKIDGIVLVGPAESAYRDMLRKVPDIPVLFLDSYDVFNANDGIISDGYHGMCEVTRHLIELGHRDICFVGSLNVTSSINDRYSGYCRAMLEYGVSVTPQMTLPDRTPDGDVRIDLPEAFEREMPTAFVCNCDTTACLLVRTLRERGLRVPEDVSVAGFDDYVYPGFEDMGLTTYSVDTDAMVQACVGRLMKKIANPRSPLELKTIPGHLIVRKTTGPARSAKPESLRRETVPSGVPGAV